MKKPIEPIVVKAPKKRIPNAPPTQTHRSRKEDTERVPSGRLAKHKKLIQDSGTSDS
jgi:hypothetical protein